MWIGLIPAHAGKTFPLLSFAFSFRAHPRSRGENGRVKISTRAGWGSSPLTRGKRRAYAVNLIMCGLIPAHAGKTCFSATNADTASAHPRSRGENAPACEPADSFQGSSPLTRGKLRPLRGKYWWGRLIPAHAGKTCSYAPRASAHTAHPRSRGENLACLRGRCVVPGSSPLTRGKLVRGGPGLSACGLIPAHAGKTRTGQP